jgi:acyl-coenzyme A synthetase/AMP-(fatty) acid ligase
MAVSVPASLPTVTGLLLARAGSPEPGLAFEDRRWSWQQHVSECARYAAALRARRTPGRPFHVGVLADNVPEFSFLLGGCAFAGAVLVALNPVRRGEALARDVIRTDCQYVLAEPGYAALLPAMDVPVLPLDGFAGYYDDAEADESRIRDGMYWSGDLGYADSDGFCWFAGRAGQWLRVDGENLGTAPIERALLRHPAIAEAAVYGVPDPGEASGGHGGIRVSSPPELAALATR